MFYLYPHHKSSFSTHIFRLSSLHSEKLILKFNNSTIRIMFLTSSLLLLPFAHDLVVKLFRWTSGEEQWRLLQNLNPLQEYVLQPRKLLKSWCWLHDPIWSCSPMTQSSLVPFLQFISDILPHNHTLSVTKITLQITSRNSNKLPWWYVAFIFSTILSLSSIVYI